MRTSSSSIEGRTHLLPFLLLHRSTLRSGRLLEVLVLFVQAALLTVLVIHHEPWFDEAQAWLLVRDCDLTDLVSLYLGYDTSPPLWHLLLMVPAKLRLPYHPTLNLLSAGCAVLASALFLFGTSLPRFFRLLLPFTYGLGYQYSVVARSYAPLVALLALLAVLYPRRMERPGRYLLALLFLAATYFHGTLVAGTLYAVFVLERLAAAFRAPTGRRQVFFRLVGEVVVATMLLSLLYQVIRPPEDYYFHAGFDLGRRLLLFSPTRTLQETILPVIAGATTGHILTALPILCVLSAWLWGRKALHLLVLPWLALLGLFALLYVNSWHHDLLFLVLVFACAAAVSRSPRRPAPWLDRASAACLVLLAISQLPWTWSTAQDDLRKPYSGAAVAAQYLQDHHPDQPVFLLRGSFCGFALQPYFARNIFSNYRHPFAFYWWSSKADLDGGEDALRRERPEVVVACQKLQHELEPDLALAGYRRVLYAPGELFFKGSVKEREDFLVFVAEDP